MQAITKNEGLKKQRRDIEKKMTVHVQQISATMEQVNGYETFGVLLATLSLYTLVLSSRKIRLIGNVLSTCWCCLLHFGMHWHLSHTQREYVLVFLCI